MQMYFSPSKGFCPDDVYGTKTMQVPDPKWTRPTVQVPDPNWQRPMIPDPAWVRPNILVPDPNWKAPLTLQPDPNWQRPLVAVTAADGSTVKVLDMGAQPPMIELPDPTAKPDMIESPDPNAQPDMIPDAAAVQPTIAVPDMSAVCPQIEVANPACILPADAVPITTETYNSVHAQLATGMVLSADSSGNPVAVAPPSIPLATLQSNACNQIDAAAGQVRGKYTTQVPGQNEVYQLKLNEAQAYQKATSPVATDYPHLNAEATQTNTPIATVAQNVINTYNQWLPISAKIEGYRLGGKQAVNAATDAAGVQAALNTALSNLEGC